MQARLTVPQRHQLRIAKDTLRNPMKALLGGPSVREAEEIVARLTGGRARIWCDSCNLARIQGLICHETGCPNSRKTWVPERGEWVLYLECRECGCEVEAGTGCCNG